MVLNNNSNNSPNSKRHNPKLPRRMTRSSTSTDSNCSSNSSTLVSNNSNNKIATGNNNISGPHDDHTPHLACTTPANGLPLTNIQPLGKTLDLTTNNGHDACYDPSPHDDGSLPSTARGSSPIDTVNHAPLSSDSSPDSPNLLNNNALRGIQRPQNLTATFNLVRTMSADAHDYGVFYNLNVRPDNTSLTHPRMHDIPIPPTSVPTVHPTSISPFPLQLSTSNGTLGLPRSITEASRVTVPCTLCGRSFTRTKNGQPHKHACRPVTHAVVSNHQPDAVDQPLQSRPSLLSSITHPPPLAALNALIPLADATAASIERFNPPSPTRNSSPIRDAEPLQSDPSLWSSIARLPPQVGPNSLTPLADVAAAAIHRLDPISPTRNAESIISGAVEDPASPAAAPVLSVRGRRHQQRQTMAQWSAVHLQLLRITNNSRTRGELEDNLLALLQLAPPRAHVLPTTDNTTLLVEPNDPPSSLNLDYGDDDIVGVFQPSIPSTDRIIKAMNRHILHGDLPKARRATKGSGVAQLGDPRVRTVLRSKYPPSMTEPPTLSASDIERQRVQPIDHHLTIIDDTDSLTQYILGKKRGASTSTSGHSNDHFQDLLKFHPDAIHDIMTLCNLIAIGSLMDGPARAKLVEGKGTALIKNTTDCRPIVTEHPYLKYTGHALVVTYGDRIRTICGAEQFMGASAGCEIVSHLIRNRLESDPTLVVGKVDCKNAFNEIHKDAILEIIRDEIPVLLPFANLMLSMSPVTTVFNDTRARLTSVHSMVHGVPQGGCMSSAFFNLGQSRSIREASRLHPNVSILLIADDTHVLGRPEEVVDAIVTIRRLYSRIGLSLAATTASKNVLFSLGEQHTEAQRALADAAQLHWLPSTRGLEVGGTPVGTYSFMTEFVNKRVDAIIDELTQFCTYIDGPNGTMKARVQTIFAMIRQCSAQQLTHLLRTCPPSTTLHASLRLDTAIANAIYHITDSNKFLPPEGSIQMLQILNRLFLSIRLGGDGMTNSTETREAAYVASIVQCAPSMRQFCADAGVFATDTTIVTSIHEFQLALASLSSKGVTCLSSFNSLNIWTSQAQVRVQHQISAQLQALRQTAALQALPTGPPNNGGPINQLSPDDAARRRQGLVNCTCRASGAWLSGNPCMWRTMMNNALFNLSYAIRNMFDLRGSRTHCICGVPMDCLWDHTRICSRATVRSKASNPAHATVTHSLRRELEIGCSDGHYSLVPGEPFMSDFFQRRGLQQTHQDDDARPARRADIAFTNFDTNATTLIDVTVASHNSQSAAADYTVGRAADARIIDKRRRYEREYHTNNPNAKLVVFAVESSGAVHPEAHQFLKEHAKLTDPSNHGRKLGQLLTSLSVSIQAARARSITTARDLLSVDGAPTIPYTNGPLPTVPPPVSVAPTLYPRHYALTPLPLRTLPLLNNTIYYVPWTNIANDNLLVLTMDDSTLTTSVGNRFSFIDANNFQHNSDAVRTIQTLTSSTSVHNSHQSHNWHAHQNHRVRATTLSVLPNNSNRNNSNGNSNDRDINISHEDINSNNIDDNNDASTTDNNNIIHATTTTNNNSFTNNSHNNNPRTSSSEMV